MIVVKAHSPEDSMLITFEQGFHFASTSRDHTFEFDLDHGNLSNQTLWWHYYGYPFDFTSNAAFRYCNLVVVKYHSWRCSKKQSYQKPHSSYQSTPQTCLYSLGYSCDMSYSYLGATTSTSFQLIKSLHFDSNSNSPLTSLLVGIGLDIICWSSLGFSVLGKNLGCCLECQGSCCQVLETISV